ncbi:LysR family transcriptional regulator [Vannielia litorea]|uniref:LysR family transcriptional regulator n=1 Tax=Vannielia litorea TaxID=1217970 RepID=UPI001BCA6DB3|nr:LysR family transcriptional regulator [Vannielia litorea]MBS8228513.1 LysR family transcriptional regulator [Vannielia litorea]
MDTLDQLRAFTATAQAGSFTGGAEMLGISNRLTSKYVAELEARLGVRLFQRTTRRVGLTPAGEELLARAPALLDELDDVLSDLAEGSRGFTGTLRISAPVTFGEIWVAAMLGRFTEANPGLTIDLRLTDSFADLAREGIDLAFRIGQSDMLSLKTRKLGTSRSLVVASPAYLDRHGTPARPQDLANHACIVDTNRRTPRRWVFRQGGEEVAVSVEGRFSVNSASAAVELATAGVGLANVPRFALCGAVEAGWLVPLFPGITAEAGPVSAVYLEGRALPRKTRALIDFAADDLKSADIL